MSVVYHNEIPRDIVLLKRENPGVLIQPTVRVNGRMGPTVGPMARGLLSWDTDYNLMTNRCRQRLGLPLIRGERLLDRELNGIGRGVLGRTRFEFCPHYSDRQTMQLNVVVVDSITQQIPSAREYTMLRPHLADITLADPSFEEPGSVDFLTGLLVSPLLLGNGIKLIPGTTCYSSDSSLVDGSIFVPPVIKVGNQEIVGTGLHAQETVLGWVITGRLPPVEDVKIIPPTPTEQVGPGSDSDD